MKILPNFIKTFKENIRDWKILILVVVFAPFFVYLMYMYLGSSGVIYNVILLNLDGKGIYANELIDEWTKIKNEDGKSVINILQVSDSESAKKMIRDKNADLFITIPEDFSDSLRNYLNNRKGLPSPILNFGDQTNIKYMMSTSLIDYASFSYIGIKTGIEIPLNVRYESSGNQRKIRDFDLFVPGSLVLSVIMMLFTAGASIVREIEKETINRLSLSKLSSFDFMTALIINQTIIGIIGLLLALLSAFSVGYKTDGSILLILLIGTIACFSIISISIIMTCFIKSMFGLLTIGCFPFFILMFFSDCFMPLPKINLFGISGNQIYLNDILPTATAIKALNKVLNYSSGISDIQFELVLMIISSVIYFMIGIILFKWKYKY